MRIGMEAIARLFKPIAPESAMGRLLATAETKMPNQVARIALEGGDGLAQAGAGTLALDPLERLERWVKVKKGEIPSFPECDPNQWGDVLHEDLAAGVEYIKYLHGLLDQRDAEARSGGRCAHAENGQHMWAAFPVGLDGRQIIGTLLPSCGSNGVFCQHCGMRQPAQTKETTHVGTE
jgi:hypothetical protein